MSRDRLLGPDRLPAVGERVDAVGGDRAAIQSIDRAADILALLDQDTPTLTTTLVAERLGLNRTTAHRYLQSLQRAGFLGATLGPGPLLDQLSALASVRQQVLTFAPAVMRQLSDETGLTSVVSFLGTTGAVVTLVEEAYVHTIVLTVRTGTVLPLKSAQTRVLLAFQSDSGALGRAHAMLPPAEAAKENAALAEVRRHRLAWADLGREGVESVAAPVFGPHGTPAALALIGTTAVLRPAQRPNQPVQALVQAAQTLSSMITN